MDNIRIELNNGGLYFRGNFKEKVKSETVKDVEWNFEDAVQHLANSFDFMEIRGNEISHIESDNTIVCSDRDVNYTYWNHGILRGHPTFKFDANTMIELTEDNYKEFFDVMTEYNEIYKEVKKHKFSWQE